MTTGDLWIAPIVVPLPVVLVGGAGAVVATAAVLSARAAHRPELPVRRWSRPLPAMLCRAVEARPTRVSLRILGLMAGIAGIVALARRNDPVDAFVAIVVVTAVSVVAGPVIRALDPFGAFTTQPRAPDDHRGTHTSQNHATSDAGADVRPAAAWLTALCAVGLVTHDPRLLAGTATGYVALRVLGAWRGVSVDSDPVGAFAGLMAQLAPIGRDHDGKLAWRNPLVAVAHAGLPLGAVGLGAVIIAASLTHAALLQPAWRARLDNPASTVVLLGVTLAVVAGALRLALIRPFLRSATVPLAAAYGVVAAGRWLPPVDVLAFVALHIVAVGVLHRQALARYDLRTARAVQFPVRIVFVVSVLSGLTLLVGP